MRRRFFPFLQLLFSILQLVFALLHPPAGESAAEGGATQAEVFAIDEDESDFLSIALVDDGEVAVPAEGGAVLAEGSPLLEKEI